MFDFQPDEFSGTLSKIKLTVFIFCGLNMSYYCNRRCTQIHADLVGARLGARLALLAQFFMENPIFQDRSGKTLRFPE